MNLIKEMWEFFSVFFFLARGRVLNRLAHGSDGGIGNRNVIVSICSITGEVQNRAFRT